MKMTMTMMRNDEEGDLWEIVHYLVSVISSLFFPFLNVLERCSLVFAGTNFISIDVQRIHFVKHNCNDDGRTNRRTSQRRRWFRQDATFFTIHDKKLPFWRKDAVTNNDAENAVRIAIIVSHVAIAAMADNDRGVTMQSFPADFCQQQIHPSATILCFSFVITNATAPFHAIVTVVVVVASLVVIAGAKQAASFAAADDAN